MKENGWMGKTVTLKFKLDTYQGKIRDFNKIFNWIFGPVFTRAKSFDRWITQKEDLLNVRLF